METKKRKPLLIINEPKGWGSFTCPFCKKRIISYMHDRHVNSKSHNDILLKQNAVQVSNDLTIRFAGHIDEKLLESIRQEIKKNKK